MRLAHSVHVQDIYAEDQMFRPSDYGAPLINDHTYRRVVCLDFDGVLNKSTGPYARGHFGNPIPEGLKMLRQLLDAKFDVVILTARRETDLVSLWLKKQGFRNMLVTNHKVPAIAYVDDHAIHFPDDAKADDMLKLIRKASR